MTGRIIYRFLADDASIAEASAETGNMNAERRERSTMKAETREERRFRRTGDERRGKGRQSADFGSFTTRENKAKPGIFEDPFPEPDSRWGGDGSTAFDSTAWRRGSNSGSNKGDRSQNGNDSEDERKDTGYCSSDDGESSTMFESQAFREHKRPTPRHRRYESPRFPPRIPVPQPQDFRRAEPRRRRHQREEDSRGDHYATLELSRDATPEEYVGIINQL